MLEKVRGITDIQVPPLLGQPTIKIDIDRQRAARYGLSPGDINATIQAAVGGQAAGDLYEEGSDRHFPMLVRLAPRYRENMEALRRIAIGAPGPNGGVVQVPLAEVANVGLSTGAFYIYREAQERYIPVKFSVRGRDLGGAVLEAQEKVAAEVKLPSGYRLDWAGDFANFQNAMARLAIAVPIAIALILLLLYVSFGSLVDTLIAGSAIPMALVGGILGLCAGRHVVQHLGRHRLRRPVRHRRHERHHGGGLLQPPDRGRPRTRGGAAPDLRAADAAGADDLHRRLRRPAARRLLDGDRQPGPAPARHRRGRRHAAGALLFLTVLPADHRHLLTAPRPGYI